MTMMDPLVTTVVIDDHPFFRDGLSRGLTSSGRIKVLGEAGTAAEGMALIRELRPQVAVCDYQLPDRDGIAVIQAVRRDDLPTHVLLLSAFTEGSVVYHALEQGAKGYLSKDATRSEIVAAVADVARGGYVMPPGLASGLAQQIRLRSVTRGPIVSPRELQVLRGFADGRSIPELASALFLGASTVRTHTQHLYEKLGVSDRGAAVAAGIRAGLIE
jgi:two-component system nitrate/nitrite response regulator NarL